MHPHQPEMHIARVDKIIIKFFLIKTMFFCFFFLTKKKPFFCLFQFFLSRVPTYLLMLVLNFKFFLFNIICSLVYGNGITIYQISWKQSSIQYHLSLPYLNVRFSLSVMSLVNQMEFEPKGLFILFFLVIARQ